MGFKTLVNGKKVWIGTWTPILGRIPGLTKNALGLGKWNHLFKDAKIIFKLEGTFGPLKKV